jgi:hypothetical protein
MKLKDIQSLYENLDNKFNKLIRNNNDFKTKQFLLEQEFMKRYNEIILWYKTEKNKLMVQHNQRNIDLQ